MAAVNGTAAAPPDLAPPEGGLEPALEEETVAVESIDDEFEGLQKELAESRDSLLRMRADFENYRRRAAK